MKINDSEFTLHLAIGCILLIVVLILMIATSYAQSAGFGDICDSVTGSPYTNYNPDLIANPIYASGADYDENPNGCSWRLLPFTENDYRTPAIPVDGVSTEYVIYEFVARADITDTFVSVQLNYVDENGDNHPVVFDLELLFADGWQSFSIAFDGFQSEIGGPNSQVSMQFGVSDSDNDVLIDKIRMLAFEPSTATPTATVPIPSPSPTPQDCSNQFFYLDNFIDGYDWPTDGVGIPNIDRAYGPPDTLEVAIPFDELNNWTFWTFALSQTISSDAITVSIDVDYSAFGSIFATHPLAGRTDPYPTHKAGVLVDPNDDLDTTGWTNRIGNEIFPAGVWAITSPITISTFMFGVDKTSGGVPANIFVDGVIFETQSAECQQPATPTPTPSATITPTSTITPPTATPFPIPTSTRTPQAVVSPTTTFTPIPIPTGTPNPTATGFAIPTFPAPGTPFPIPTPLVGGSCNTQIADNYDFCFDYGFVELECWIIIPTIQIIAFPGFQICFELYGVVAKVFGYIIPTYLIVVLIGFLIIWRWIL